MQRRRRTIGVRARRIRSHLAPSARPDIEHAVHHRVHAGIRAGEEEQSFLDSLVHR